MNTDLPAPLSSKPIRHKRGAVREDGLLFWQYKGLHEVWMSPSYFDARKKRSLETTKDWVNANRRRVNDRQNLNRDLVENARRAKEWRAKNKQRCRELKQEWRDRNREIVRAQNAAYWAKYPEKRAEIRNRRRAREYGIGCGDRNLIKEFYRMVQRVAKCTGIKFEVDHIVSLHSGGKHDVSNLQILPMIINRRKGRKSFVYGKIA
jgi:hypothetical protein